MTKHTLYIFPIIFSLAISQGNIGLNNIPSRHAGISASLRHPVSSIQYPVSRIGSDTLPFDSVPELNRQIITLVREQMGKTVGRGECWDLAALVLNKTGARWDGKYVFGRKVDPDKECVFPGDLIQFEGVRIRYSVGRTVFNESMQHHTAVINEVKSKGVYVLAHQNTSKTGRRVGVSGLDIRTIIGGKCTIYRPVKGNEQ